MLHADDATVAGKSISYHEDIRPIFQAKCTGCHQPSKAKGKYVMTTFARLLKGGGTVAMLPLYLGNPVRVSFLSRSPRIRMVMLRCLPRASPSMRPRLP